MTDHALRDLERTVLGSPGDLGLRLRLARAAQRAGDPERAAGALGVDLVVRIASLPALTYGGRPVSRVDVAALVEPDLLALDVVALFDAFPRRADGRLRRNTTRFLRRYPARELGAGSYDRAADPRELGWSVTSTSRSLVLFAWTAGTANRLSRRKARRVTLTIELATRSTYRADHLLPEAAWRCT